MSNQSEEEFLRDDLYDALRWLFEGAIAWEAARVTPQRAGRHQIVFGMSTNLVQARALYEFFYKKGKGDDFRVKDFATKWDPPESSLYKEYMDRNRPVQKRVFHLVRNRTIHAGGTGPDELKRQALEFARDLRELMEEFRENSDPIFQGEIRSALARAIREAEQAADHYGIPNPLKWRRSRVASLKSPSTDAFKI